MLDALLQEILARPVSSRGAKLRCEVHPGQSRDAGEVG